MKRAYILMEPLFIAALCKPMEKRTFSIKSDIPEDALFITAEYSDSQQCFKVIFEHESFDDIEEGQKIPRIDSPRFTRYIGQTSDLHKRMMRHNSEESGSRRYKYNDKQREPWRLIYSEKYAARGEAMKQERFLEMRFDLRNKSASIWNL